MAELGHAGGLSAPPALCRPSPADLSLRIFDATPDGILDGLPHDALAYLGIPDIGPSGYIIVNSKTVDPRINLSEPKPAHVFQIQVQLGLVREQTRFQPAYGLLSYVNASFFDDVVEFAIKFNSRSFAQAYVRATAIMNAKTAGDLPPEGFVYNRDECERCPYAAPCQALRGDVPTAKEEALTPELFDKIIAHARETKRLQDAAKAATGRGAGERTSAQGTSAHEQSQNCRRWHRARRLERDQGPPKLGYAGDPRNG